MKKDAVPDVPLKLQNEVSSISLPARPRVRGAFEKRARAEIVSSVICNNALMDITRTVTNHDEEEMDETQVIQLPNTTQDTCCQTMPPIMCNKKVQVKLLPPQRTRSHQTDAATSPMCRSFGTQTDPKITKIRVTPAAHIEIPDQTSTVSYESEEEDEIDSDVCMDSDDEDYHPTSDDLECSDDDDGEGEVNIMNYRLENDVSPVEEKQFLVSETALTELLSVCRYCSGDCTPLIQFTRGTMIVTRSVCVNGHSFTWKSQPCHKTLPWCNLLTASAIMTSGSSGSKVLQLFHNMNLQMFSTRTCSRLISLYVVPSIQTTWIASQAHLLEQIQGQEVVLGGDARCDSPGYSAKYGTYTLMDLEANKILTTNLVQCNEVASSTHMELEGLKRGLACLDRHVTVKALVTDRHSMVKKFMREEHSDIRHYFDVWHVAKGISKKLEAMAKKKRGQEIRPWIKAIVNHMHWVSASCDGDGELVSAKWLSLMNHIRNKHVGHSQRYPACEHGELTEDRAWLKEGSVPFKLLNEVVTSKFLMKDIPKLSPVHQTYVLEVFHSIVNHFAPKSTHFQYAAMNARNSVAALHYNENSNRPQATTKDGQLQFATCYPKAKKGTVAVVKPCKPPPTFGYVSHIQQAVVDRRTTECPTYKTAGSNIRLLNMYNPPTLASTFERFEKEELIQHHRSRFLNTSVSPSCTN